MVENLIFFILSISLLIISGIILVRSLAIIARFLGISEFYAAFIIMAFATSFPELFIGINSAMSGNPEISLGNIIGANILDLTLISGIIILSAKKIKQTKKESKSDYLMLVSIILVITLYLIGNSLSRIDGFILLSFFAINVYKIFKGRKNKKGLKYKERGFFWISLFLFGLLLLFISSKFVVKYGTNLVITLNFPKIILGIFLISFATTLPELTFGLSAATKHKSMAIGDQVGSVFVNSTLILGLVAIIEPIKLNNIAFNSFLISSIFLLISAYIFIKLANKNLEKKHGLFLILVYLIFLLINTLN